MNNLFFLHIPKTAGTSLRFYLQDMFPSDEIWPFVSWTGVGTKQLKELPGYKLVYGHFDSRILSYVPPDFCKAVFFREPIARTVSAIDHAIRDENFCPSELDMSGKSFPEIIRDPDLMRFFSNSQTVLLSGLDKSGLGGGGHPETGKLGDLLLDELTIDLDSAIANLEKFDCVGVVEHFYESVLYLAKVVGLYPPKISPSRNQAPIASKLSNEDIEILRKYNEFDLLLYQKALEVFHRQIGSSREELVKIFFENRNPVVGAVSLQAPFPSWGWNEEEVNKNGDIERWSGPSLTSGITLKLDPGKKWSVGVRYFVDDSNQYATRVDFFVNGKETFPELLKEDGLWNAKLIIDVPVSSSGITDIEFLTDKVGKPPIENRDLRTLGFMLVGCDALLVAA